MKIDSKKVKEEIEKWIGQTQFNNKEKFWEVYNRDISDLKSRINELALNKEEQQDE